jgi:hypothetical protein
MKFLYPVPASTEVTQTFEDHVRRAAALNLQNYNGGIDWAVGTGSSVKAAQAGTVSVIRNDATGYGTHVRIQHTDGYLTIYGHLQSTSVAVGDEVKAGQVIGKSDNTGSSTGPHLHFELRLNNHPIDPMPLLVTTVAGLSGEEEVPQKPNDVGNEPGAFPKLPKIRVVTAALRVRSKPGTDGLHLTNLPAGLEVEVIRKIIKGNDIWLQIGHDQYVAMKFMGDIYAQWI